MSYRGLVRKQWWTMEAPVQFWISIMRKKSWRVSVQTHAHKHTQSFMWYSQHSAVILSAKSHWMSAVLFDHRSQDSFCGCADAHGQTFSPSSPAAQLQTPPQIWQDEGWRLSSRRRQLRKYPRGTWWGQQVKGKKHFLVQVEPNERSNANTT